MHQDPEAPFFPPPTQFVSEPVSISQVAGFVPHSTWVPTLLYTDGSTYFGNVDPINGTPHGLGIMLFKFREALAPARGVTDTALTSRFSTGDRYGGRWEDGRFHGAGVLISSTCTYIGSWSQGRPHGKGVIQYSKSYVDREEGNTGFGGAMWRGLARLSPFEAAGNKPQEYTGDFHRDHHRHGEGKMRYYNGDTYEGSWVENVRNGYGKFVGADGQMYKGHWLNDERHGRGTIQYPDGSLFKGVLVHNKREGPGTLRCANGDEYSGQFTEDNIDGDGIMRYKNGDVYEGQWKDGRRQGEGEYTLKKTGACMRGTFVRGLIHGKGTVTVPGISLFSGSFNRGIRSEGTMYWLDAAEAEFKNMTCYQGEWRGEQIVGKGLLWFRDGGFYYGCFQQNKREGKGNMHYRDGSEYSGNFHDGAPHGWGVMQDPTGKIRAGVWAHGKLLEGYTGGWNGETLHGMGHISVAVRRLFSPSPFSSTAVGRGSSDAAEAEVAERTSCFMEFKGLFHKGAREGPGVLKLPSAGHGHGPWEALLVGKREDKNGTTKTYRARQHVISGCWKSNKLECSRGVWAFPSGEVYAGAFVNNGREDACGRLWLPDGSVFVGGWARNAPSGKGTFYSNSRQELWCPEPSRPGSVKTSPTAASEKSSRFLGVDLFGMFRSSEETEGSSVPNRKMATRCVGSDYHYVLMGTWVQKQWSVKTCQSLIPVCKAVLPEDLIPGSTLAMALNGVTAWVDGPDSTRKVTYLSSGDAADLSECLKPPLSISIGKVDGDALVLFPSGIMIICRFADNCPQIVVPHRPHSILDNYLTHKAQSTFQEIPGTPPPSCSSALTASLSGLPNATPVTAWRSWKPFSFTDKTLASEPMNRRVPKPLQCTFCSADFSFFRRDTECGMCFRSACSSCLQAMDANSSPAIASVLAQSRALLRQTRKEEPFFLPDEPLSPSGKPGPILVCPDCVRTVHDKVSYGIVWLPLHIISSLMATNSKSTAESQMGSSAETGPRPRQGGPRFGTPDLCGGLSKDESQPRDHQGYVTYAGYTSCGVPHVYGELWWSDDAYYVGPFDHGSRTGFGYQIFRDGSAYRGLFQNDLWNGRGIYFFANGDVLEGVFYDGRLKTPVYHGEMSADLLYHGLGVRYHSNGTIYNGQWEKGKMHGEGFLQYLDGSFFTGSFVQDRIQGLGKLITGSSVYYGLFEDGKKEGSAVEFFSSCAVQGTIFDRKTGDIYDTTYFHGNERDDCFPLPVSADDTRADTCAKCKRTFYLLLRRHHCRLCGLIFCDSCTMFRAVLPSHFPVPSGSLHRVCDACFQRQEQRRTIAVRHYGSGDVYAGCWSQGRWVSRGLYAREDGLFVVMDSCGAPLHGSLRDSSPALKPSVCRDAAPPRAVLSSVSESSSFRALNDFLEWWERARKDCSLQVPLAFSLVENFLRHKSYFAAKMDQTAKNGGHDASLLASKSVSLPPYPSLPSLPKPLHFAPLQNHGTTVALRFPFVASLQCAARSPPPPPEEGSFFQSSQQCGPVEPPLGFPRMEDFDISDKDVSDQMNRWVQEHVPCPPRLLLPAPPLPPFGSDERIPWEDWGVKRIPVLFPEVSTKTEEWSAAEAQLYYACPFWRNDVDDVERVVEEGKVSKAKLLLAGEDSAATLSSGWLPAPLPSPLRLDDIELEPFADYLFTLSRAFERSYTSFFTISMWALMIIFLFLFFPYLFCDYRDRTAGRHETSDLLQFEDTSGHSQQIASYKSIRISLLFYGVYHLRLLLIYIFRGGRTMTNSNPVVPVSVASCGATPQRFDSPGSQDRATASITATASNSIHSATEAPPSPGPTTAAPESVIIRCKSVDGWQAMDSSPNIHFQLQYPLRSLACSSRSPSGSAKFGEDKERVPECALAHYIDAAVQTGFAIQAPKPNFQRQRRPVLPQGYSIRDWHTKLELRKRRIPAGIPQRKISRVEVEQHNTEGSLWVVVRGVVYDVTEFQRFHPCCGNVLERCGGRDITALVDAFHPWIVAQSFLVEADFGCFIRHVETDALLPFASDTSYFSYMVGLNHETSLLEGCRDSIIIHDGLIKYSFLCFSSIFKTLFHTSQELPSVGFGELTHSVHQTPVQTAGAFSFQRMSCCSSFDTVVEARSAPEGLGAGKDDSWKIRLAEDIGTDTKAVERDFPRMLVFVNAGRRHNYNVNISSQRQGHHQIAFEQRLQHVREAVQLVAELCGEGNTFGAAFRAAWDFEVSRHTQEPAEIDVHAVMRYAIEQSGMVQEQAGEYVVCSKTFVVLLFTVQGTMFHPSQHLNSLMDLSWVSHMQDSGWTIHIYPETASDGCNMGYQGGQDDTLAVTIQHKQIVKHYVEKSDRRRIPRFQIQYACSMTVALGRGDMKPIASRLCRSVIRETHLEIVDIQLEIPRCSCLLRSWKCRANDLKNKAQFFECSFDFLSALAGMLLDLPSLIDSERPRSASLLTIGVALRGVFLLLMRLTLFEMLLVALSCDKSRTNAICQDFVTLFFFLESVRAIVVESSAMSYPLPRPLILSVSHILIDPMPLYTSPMPCRSLFLGVTLTLLLVVFGCSASSHEDTLSSPVAEVLYSSYNPWMASRKDGDGKRIQDLISSDHPVVKRRDALQREREERGFCFVSFGCWGGDIPHSERQTTVRNHLMELLEKGFQISGDRLMEEGTLAESTAPYPIHFVLAAGDNVYPKGVTSKDSLSFFTVFESFYRVDNRFDRLGTTASSSSTSEISVPNVSQFIPWLMALGNHDAIQSSQSQVDYTYYSIEHREELIEKWVDDFKQKDWKMNATPAPSGRWYMPAAYYAMKVSDDTVIVVLDAPQLHRCAVYKQRISEPSEVSEDRERSIKATAEDCEMASKQKEMIEHWLLNQYADVPVKVIMSHYPMMSNGPHVNYPFLVDWLEPLLLKSCAVLYVNADNHYLQVSRGDLIYYANSGAGAGNSGRLHFRDGKKNTWDHPRSKFQSVEGGFMVHCSVKSSDAGQRFLNYVIGEDGKVQFSFEIDLHQLRRCRSSTGLSKRRRGEMGPLLFLVMKKLVGLSFVFVGIRILRGVQLGKLDKVLAPIVSRMRRQGGRRSLHSLPVSGPLDEARGNAAERTIGTCIVAVGLVKLIKRIGKKFSHGLQLNQMSSATSPTNDEQRVVEASVLRFLRKYAPDVFHLWADETSNIGADPALSLDRMRHTTFLTRKLDPFKVHELTYAAQPWLIYWAVQAAETLGVTKELFDAVPSRDLVQYLLLHLVEDVDGSSKASAQRRCAFAGAPCGKRPHLLSSYAACCALCILDVNSLQALPRADFKRWLLSIRRSDGSFPVARMAESDIRCSYAVAVITTLLGLDRSDTFQEPSDVSHEPLLTTSVAEYVVSCQTHEGGFSSNSNCAEAHGSYTLCALGTLFIMREMHKCYLPGLRRWLAMRQSSFEGAFNGRTNKVVDSCYSYWIGASHVILRAEECYRKLLLATQLSPPEGLKRFVLAKEMALLHYLQVVDINNVLTTDCELWDTEEKKHLKENDIVEEFLSSETLSPIAVKRTALANELSEAMQGVGSGAGNAHLDEDTGDYYFNQKRLQLYVLLACQANTGGLRDKPSASPDQFHTCYSLGGMSIAQNLHITDLAENSSAYVARAFSKGYFPAAPRSPSESSCGGVVLPAVRADLLSNSVVHSSNPVFNMSQKRVLAALKLWGIRLTL
eukprot:gene10470-7275_t